MNEIHYYMKLYLFESAGFDLLFSSSKYWMKPIPFFRKAMQVSGHEELEAEYSRWWRRLVERSVAITRSRRQCQVRPGWGLFHSQIRIIISQLNSLQRSCLSHTLSFEFCMLQRPRWWSSWRRRRCKPRPSTTTPTWLAASPSVFSSSLWPPGSPVCPGDLWWEVCAGGRKNMWLFVTESWWGMDNVQDEEMMSMLMYQVSEDGEIRPGEGGTSAAVPHT